MKTNPQTNGMSRSAFLRTIVLALPLLPAAAVKAQTLEEREAEPKLDLGNLRAFVELARSDIRTQKALIIAQNIQFTEAEAVEFWPLHRDYETGLNKLLDQRYALIMEFAKHYDAMTDAKAAELAAQAFDLEEKRTALRRKYFKKFRQVVPTRKAARFFQIENQLNLAMDLQVAAALPLIK